MCSGDFKLHKERFIQGGKERNVIDSTNRESSQKGFWQKATEWLACEGIPGRADPKTTLLLAKHLLVSGLHQLLKYTHHNTQRCLKLFFFETEAITNLTQNLQGRHVVTQGKGEKTHKDAFDSSSLHNEPDSQLMHSLIFPFIPIELWYSVQLACLKAG